MLKRYWIVLYPEDRYGPGNIGVSANSKTEAMSLAVEALGKIKWAEKLSRLKENKEILEDVDVRILDPNHVLPNMGVVVWKGVWWPNLNH